MKFTAKSLDFPPQFRTLFEQQLGSPVYLDVISGNLPDRVQALAEQMAEDAVKAPRRETIRTAPHSGQTKGDESHLPEPSLSGEPGESGDPRFHIGRWLTDIGLAQYTADFEKNDIDTVALLKSLNADDLTAIGIQSVGHRKRLLSGISSLGGEPVGVAAPAEHSGAVTSLDAPTSGTTDGKTGPQRPRSGKKEGSGLLRKTLRLLIILALLGIAAVFLLQMR